ncbi:MAG: membrane-bound lytic murein transglycosylase MltF [Desulfobacteraceae bacterium]|nr:membrane-bound lytic murein transglycosylase MltF [Desulfobacteraceae bacterium]
MLVLCLELAFICVQKKKNGNLFLGGTTLYKVKKAKTIRMITSVNANSYYIYQGTPMGFEYELAKAFADYLNLDLEVVTPGWNAMTRFLEQGWGDFIAAGLTITDDRKKVITFSDPYMTVQQKLIHHKLIFGVKSIDALAGKTIHVRRGTSYHAKLEQIKQSGVDITIVLHDNTPTDELIRMVADRQIKYTVADSNIALLNRRYYPDIVIGLDLEQEQPLAWAVKSKDPTLLAAMNQFLASPETKKIQKRLHKKYYSNLDAFDYFDLKKFHERIETRLPRYKDTIEREALKYGFDWRMIAAVVYQESHFNPWARSRTGVRGLMQVTMDTAKEMGISNRLNPEQSLKAGIQYLDKLYQRFDDIHDPHQRLLFALGSYNIGYGHIRDAQLIAQGKGWDKTRWHTMEKTLPLLTKKRYYQTTQYGYARGREPVHYVKQILTYYDILKQKPRA